MKPLVFELFAENQQNISDKNDFCGSQGPKIANF